MRENPKYPHELASQLLERHRGDQRAAEAAAWEMQRQYEPESEMSRFVADAVRAIVNGAEHPRVPRAPRATVTFSSG